MEIQRAIDKPRMGMNLTPVLCLVHEELFDKVTWMIRGVSAIESPVFRLAVYLALQDAQNKIEEFLLENK